MKNLYEVSAEIDATGHAPSYYSQATVFTLIGADSAEEAEALMRQDLIATNCHLLRHELKIQQIPLEIWSTYVATQWSALKERLPSQAELAQRLSQNFLVQISYYPHE